MILATTTRRLLALLVLLISLLLRVAGEFQQDPFPTPTPDPVESFIDQLEQASREQGYHTIPEDSR